MFLEEGIQNATILFDGIELYSSEFEDMRFNEIHFSDTNYNTILEKNIYEYIEGYEYEEFERPKIMYENRFYHEGIDENENGLYDYLAIKVEINVTEAGEYYLEANMNLDYQTIYTYWNQPVFLEEGIQNATILFDGIEIYLSEFENMVLNHIQFSDTNYNTILEENIYEYIEEYEYEEFERPSVTLTNSFTETPIDLDNNELYDKLVIEVGINVSEPINLSASARLYPEEGYNRVYSSNQQPIEYSIGEHTINLSFLGVDIYALEQDTTFHLNGISFNSPEEEMPTIISNYQTNNYNYTEFEPTAIDFISITNIEGLDTNNNGLYDYLVINNNVTITEAGNYRIQEEIEINNENYDSLENEIYLEEGNQNIQVLFRGQDIYNSELELNDDIEVQEISFRNLNTNENFYFNIYAEYEGLFSYNQFEKPEIMYENRFYHEGIDENENELYDYLAIKVEINVTEAGEYNLEASINLDSRRIYAQWNQPLFLEEGIQNATILFDGIEIYLSEFEDMRFNGIYFSDTNYNTILQKSIYEYMEEYEYEEFERPSVTLTNLYTETPIDLNDNGLYDKLVIEMGINVSEPINLSVSGRLYPEEGYNRIYSSNQQPIEYSTGEHIINISFRGIDIYALEQYTTFELKRISFASPEEGFIEIADTNSNYVTNYYNYTEFEEIFTSSLNLFDSNGNPVERYVVMDNYEGFTNGLTIINPSEIEDIIIAHIEDFDENSLEDSGKIFIINYENSYIQDYMIQTSEYYNETIIDEDKQLYAVYATETDWVTEYGYTGQIISITDFESFNIEEPLENIDFKMYACENWSFETEECLTGWELTSNCEYISSYNRLYCEGDNQLKTIALGVSIETNDCNIELTEDYDLYDDINCLENGFIINSTVEDITLNCHGKTITGNNTGAGIMSSGSNINIIDCSFTNFDIGVSLKGATNNELSQLDIYNNNKGIELVKENNVPSNYNIIEESYIHENSNRNIDLQRGSSYNLIRNNFINGEGVGSGIILNTGIENVIENNNIFDHDEYGLIIYASNNCSVINNTISNNQKDGIMMFASNYNLIYNNEIENNACDGIWLFGNDIHIFDASVKYNNISYNHIKFNGLNCENEYNPFYTGIRSSEFSNDNLIYGNEFIENDVNAYDEGTNFWNSDIIGNYWSDNECYDDEEPFDICDDPYIFEFAEDYLPIAIEVIITNCEDGTLNNACSINQPLYCENTNLVENCQECGCSNNEICLQDGTCEGRICEDSDQGINYEVQGTITYEISGTIQSNPETYTDYCEDRTLIEFYCVNNNMAKERYDCPELCEHGQCIIQNTCESLPRGACSEKQPYYCNENKLVQNCQKCGCSNPLICDKKTNKCIDNTDIKKEIVIEKKEIKEKKSLNKIPKLKQINLGGKAYQQSNSQSNYISRIISSLSNLFK